MKIRNGFVSNSSSSSFIVAATGEPIKAVMEVDLSTLATKITTKKELDSKVISEYGWSKAKIKEIFEDDEWLEENYNKALEALEQGKVVYWGQASYNETDDPIEFMIGNGGLSNIENIDIIMDGD